MLCDTVAYFCVGGLRILYLTWLFENGNWICVAERFAVQGLQIAASSLIRHISSLFKPIDVTCQFRFPSCKPLKSNARGYKPPAVARFFIFLIILRGCRLILSDMAANAVVCKLTSHKRGLIGQICLSHQLLRLLMPQCGGSLTEPFEQPTHLTYASAWMSASELSKG